MFPQNEGKQEATAFGSLIETSLRIATGGVQTRRLLKGEQPKYEDGYHKINGEGWVVMTTTLAQRTGKEA